MLFFAVALCCFALVVSEPTRSTFPGVGRFQFNSASENWTDAVKTCTDFGGYLAVAQSPSEAAELLRLMAFNGVEQIHYGFHDLYTEGRYVTLLDQPLENIGYQQWSPNAANNSIQLNCGSLESQGLTPANCSELLPSFCEFPLWDSYMRVGDFGYYRVPKETKTWADAKETCRQEGTSMLVIRSQEEFDAVQAQLGGYITMPFIFYGAHHKLNYYDFVTIYGEPLSKAGYLAWAPNEPREFATAQRAVAIGMSSYFNAIYRGFSLSNEYDIRQFICKRELFW